MAITYPTYATPTQDFPITHGETLLPGIESPVYYEVHVPHPLMTIIVLACFFLAASLIVWALEKYSYKDKLDFDNLPPPDRSVKRDIQINHEMAVYRARIRKQS